MLGGRPGVHAESAGSLTAYIEATIRDGRYSAALLYCGSGYVGWNVGAPVEREQRQQSMRLLRRAISTLGRGRRSLEGSRGLRGLEAAARWASAESAVCEALAVIADIRNAGAPNDPPGVGDARRVLAETPGQTRIALLQRRLFEGFEALRGALASESSRFDELAGEVLWLPGSAEWRLSGPEFVNALGDAAQEIALAVSAAERAREAAIYSVRVPVTRGPLLRQAARAHAEQALAAGHLARDRIEAIGQVGSGLDMELGRFLADANLTSRSRIIAELERNAAAAAETGEAAKAAVGRARRSALLAFEATTAETTSAGDGSPAGRYGRMEASTEVSAATPAGDYPLRSSITIERWEGGLAHGLRRWSCALCHKTGPWRQWDGTVSGEARRHARGIAHRTRASGNWFDGDDGARSPAPATPGP